MTVGEVMRRQFPVARADELVAAARGKLDKGRVRALPVLQPDGRLAGLVTMADISEAFRLINARPELARTSSVQLPSGIEPRPV